MKNFRNKILLSLVLLLIGSVSVGKITNGQALQTSKAPTNVQFPSGGSYNISTAKGALLKTDYKFSPAVQGIVTGEGASDNRGLQTFLGSSGNYIYYNPTMVMGPIGRWDITDHFNPKAPDKIEVSNGGSGGRGPLSENNQWGHHNGSPFLSVAEGAGGQARVVMDPDLGIGYNGLSAISEEYFKVWNNVNGAFWAWDSSGGSVQFGDQFKPQTGDNDFFSNNVASLATSGGNFFTYVPLRHAGSGIAVFPMTDHSGSPTLGALVDKVGKISWNTNQLLPITVGDKSFLIGRTISDPDALNMNIVYHAAEINPDSGLPSNKKDTSFSITQNRSYTTNGGLPSNTLALWGGWKVMQAVTVKGSTYIFAVDSLQSPAPNDIRSGESPEAYTQRVTDEALANSAIIVGVYKFNPTTLALTKISTVKFPQTQTYLQFQGIQIAKDEKGSAYPILIVPANKSYNNYNQNDVTLRFYDIKKFLVAGTYTAEPAFTIDRLPLKDPTEIGDIIVNQDAGSYNTLLSVEGAKTYLYLYRNAFVHQGGINYFYSVYDYYPGGGRPGALYSARGTPGLRVDKIDVTSVINGASLDNGCGAGNNFNTTTGKSCICLSLSSLGIGSKGSAVVGLQQLLEVNGYPSIKADGIYGPLTRAAVVAFCNQSAIVIPYSSVIVSSTKTPPVIGTISGPTSLGINQEGTWSVSATDANNDDLSWSVDWGDGRSTETCMLTPPKGTGKDWSFIATHAWTGPGNHIITFYTSDCKGGSGNKTIGVDVN